MTSGDAQEAQETEMSTPSVPHAKKEIRKNNNSESTEEVCGMRWGRWKKEDISVGQR